MIHEGKWSEFIREIPIKKGDFLQIDPGTVHAIKGGTLILETQQNSDITYRVYDYDRLSNGKPRELHIDKSIDVITVPAKSVADSVKSVADLPVNTLNELYVCKYFHIYKIEVSGKMTFEQNAPFMNMTVTEGNGIVNGQPVKKEIISYFQMASETWNCRAECRSLPPRYKPKPLIITACTAGRSM